MIRDIAKNIVALSVNGGIRILFGMIVQILIGRVMGAENLGKFAVMTAYFAIFQIVMQLGLPTLLIREISRQRQDAARYWWTGTVLLLAAGAMAWGLEVGIATLWGHPHDTFQMVVISGLGLIPFGLIITSEATVRGLERMEVIPVVQTIAYTVYTAVVVLVLYLHASVVMLAWALLSLQVVAGALYIMYFAYRRVILSRVHVDVALARRLIRQAFHFYGPSLAGVVPNRITIIIVAKLLGEQAGGILNAAQVLTRALFFMGSAYFEALYPALSRLFLAGKERFRTGVRLAVQYGFLFSATLSLAMMAWAPWLIGWIFGLPEYQASVPLLRILVWQAVFFVLNGTLGTVEMSANRQDLTFYIALAKVLVFAVIIPVSTLLGGLTGTAMGILVSSGVALLLHMVAVERVTRGIPPMAFWLKAIGVILVSALVTLWGPVSSLWAILPLSLATYIGGLVLVGTIRWHDMQTLRAHLTRGPL